jgi:hypothetical protein
MNEKKAVMIFPQAGIGGSIFPPDLSSFVGNYYRERGVEVLVKGQGNGLETRGEQLIVSVQSKIAP